MNIKIKRAYDAPDKDDGLRVLVDRLWPRGLTKEKAGIAMWVKELAPSTELRQWFNHDPGKWEQFQEHYLCEIKEHEEQSKLLQQEAQKGTVTLIYGASDSEHNNAVVLQAFLNG